MEPTRAHVTADPVSPADNAPEALEKLVSAAETARASDIHLQTSPKGLVMSFRLDGVVQSIATFPPSLGERILGRIKYLAHLKTYQEQLPQDGRIGRADLGSQSDVRVSTYPTVTGEKIVLRLFRESRVPELAALGLDAATLQALSMLLAQPAGLLLLTGPAGSGKTTTIYACLEHIRRQGGRHIITVEDPVEQVLPGIMQTEINEARGLDYAAAARHLLRQDPQVLALGEIRDDETARLAVRASLTGHLVLSTLHAGSCRGVLERLLTMCADRSAVAAGLSLVVNQRLVRRACARCAGAGCGDCVGTGFQGRIPVLEHLRIEGDHRHRIRDGQLDALQPGRALRELGNELCRAGLTTAAELDRVLGT